MNVSKRPLSGMVVNVSISESHDSALLGFPPWQVNRVTLQNVAALFGQGASVVFGHDWRDDGVMQAVYGFARQMQPPGPVTARDQRLLINLLPWPDEPILNREYLEQLGSTLCVRTAGLPEELEPHEDEARTARTDSSLYRYVRARGLTQLRHELTDICHARLCLGGRRTGSSGRYPGVIEEALLALRNEKPLYLAGLLGGATRQLIDAVEGKPMDDDFCSPSIVDALYEVPPIQSHSEVTWPDRVVDREAVWGEFVDLGINGLAGFAHLTVPETRELFHTRVVDRVIKLVLVSLYRIRSSSA